MKQIFTLITSFFILSAITAQTRDSHTKVAKNIEGEVNKIPESISLKETEFDFGKIPQGKPVTHLFEVVNVGTDSLKISNVTASCGCTTPEWERNSIIAPNGNTTIKVGYNAASAGTFTKTITITYNDAQTKMITIKGEVWATPGTSAPENKTLQDFK
jgi:hypothetical protein